MQKTKVTWIPQVHELGGMNPGQFQGIVPRGGAEFDENSTNLKDDIN